MLDMGVFEPGTRDYELLNARAEMLKRHPQVPTIEGIPIQPETVA
jgi:hypothetical protein